MFSISTEALLIVLYALKVELAGTGLNVGVTKTITSFPNSLTTVYIKNDKRSLYVILDTRFSNSWREYVIKRFSLVEFDIPKGSTSYMTLFASPDYTYEIHDPDFLKYFSEDIHAMVEVIKKEMC